MTVIIPPTTKGAMVAQAIDSIANADYPPNRLEIIVVDDGSTDDTWRHIQLAVKRHGDRVPIHPHAAQRRKARGAGGGFRKGTGDLFVTVDSDSVVARDALLELAVHLPRIESASLPARFRSITERRHDSAHASRALHAEL